MNVAPVEGALNKFQTIEGGKEDADGGGDSQSDAHLISAEQNQELADKVAQSWQADGGHDEEHGSATQARYGLPETAHTIHFAGVNAFLQSAHQNEQSAGADPVGNDGDKRAFQRQLVPNKNAKQHKAEVADTGIGHQALEVGLGKRQHSAIKNA